MNTNLELIDTKQEDALELVLEERIRQNKKWGSQRFLPNQLWLAILMEEVGEIAHAELEHDDDNLTEEIVQACAVLLAWLEARV